MTFRTRLLLIFALAVAAAVGMVELVVSEPHAASLRDHGSASRQRHRGAVRQGVPSPRRAKSCAPWRRIADSDVAREYRHLSGGFGLRGPGRRAGIHATGWTCLELVAGDGAIVSSAQWPAKFGYKEEWLTSEPDWNSRAAFLKREELPDGVTLALMAVRTVAAGDRSSTWPAAASWIANFSLRW